MNTAIPTNIRRWILKTPLFGRERSQPVVSKQTTQYVQSATPIDIELGDPLYDECVHAHGALQLDNLKLQSPTLARMREAGIKLLIPLVHQNELIGTLQLGARMSDQDYSSDDRRLMYTLAPQAATTLRIAQLAYQQQVEARRRERIDAELRMAGIIQQTLLPKQVPIRDGWHFATHWQPARTVGGDFYDFISLPDGRLIVIIADVTDKGVPAALVMASTRSILRSAAEHSTAPGEVLERANNLMHADMPPKMFVTCLCAVLNPQTGEMNYANAGHNAAVQRSSGDVVELRARGMPLGLMPNMKYEDKWTTLAVGDSVLMYSDGLVEAHNANREMFGMRRLNDFMRGLKETDPLIAVLRDALFTFTGAGWEQEDDVTFVTLQRASAPNSGGGASGEWTVIDTFEIASAPGNERPALDRLTAVVVPLGLPKARLERLKTAVAETVMNAMEHGNQYRTDRSVQMVVSHTDHELSVAITDHGGQQSHIDTPAPDLDAKLDGRQSPRGWGLFLVNAMVDHVKIDVEGNEHTVQLFLRNLNLTTERTDHAHPKL